MPGIRRGLLHVAQRALGRVGARVARDGLFEQPGERPRTPPLAPTVAPVEPAGTRGAGLAELRAVLGPTGRVRVVNHWATWCAPCIEELPQLKELAAQMGADAELLGLSWDLFDPRDEAEAVIAQVAAFSQEQGMSWPSLVVTAPAEELFAAFDIGWQKIPQTWVLDGQGRVLERIEGLLDAAGHARLLARIREAHP